MKKYISIFLVLVIMMMTGIFTVNAENIPGDVNGDGLVRASDARSALRFSADLPVLVFDEAAADVNSDGKVTAADARKILRFAAGLITSFDTEKQTVTTTQPATPKKVAMIGDSLVAGMYLNCDSEKIDYIGKTNVNTTNIYTAVPQGFDSNIIDTVCGGNYDVIIVLIGINEVANNDEQYKNAYTKIINTLIERNPEAQIVIHGLLPVSAARSAQNLYGVTNSAINNKNMILEGIAQEKGITYIDAGEILRDENGVLPADASSDGVHPKKTTCVKWENWLLEKLGLSDGGLQNV